MVSGSQQAGRSPPLPPRRLCGSELPASVCLLVRRCPWGRHGGAPLLLGQHRPGSAPESLAPSKESQRPRPRCGHLSPSRGRGVGTPGTDHARAPGSYGVGGRKTRLPARGSPDNAPPGLILASGPGRGEKGPLIALWERGPENTAVCPPHTAGIKRLPARLLPRGAAPPAQPALPEHLTARPGGVPWRRRASLGPEEPRAGLWQGPATPGRARAEAQQPLKERHGKEKRSLGTTRRLPRSAGISTGRTWGSTETSAPRAGRP